MVHRSSSPAPGTHRLFSHVIAYGVLMAVALGFVGPDPLAAQPIDPRYRLHMASYDQATSPVEVRQLLDIVPLPGLSTPEMIRGFSYGVCTGPGVTIVSTQVGFSIQDLNGGHPPAFLVLNDNPPGPTAGFFVGCVIDYNGLYQLGNGDGHELTRAQVLHVGALDLGYCETVNLPPVEIQLVSPGGTAIKPGVSPGVTLQGPLPEVFLRGDCNGSTSLSIPDVISLLLMLFPPSGTTFSSPCLDACDANDDGSLTLTDAIALLNALFAVPSIPLPGPGTCDLDPTDTDPLDCSSPSTCP